MSFEHLDQNNEFLENLDFIKWVNSGFVYQNEYWQEIKAELIDKSSFDNAISIIEGFSFAKAKSTSEDRKEKLINRINQTIDSDVIKSNKPKLISLRLFAAVAATLILLVSSFWFFDNTLSVKTEFAESEKIKLPDLSFVQLNVASKVQYKKRNFNKNRLVKLEGEAFFQVEKGESFIVESSNGTVEVLGTSFNVYSRNQVMEVVCHTGKVMVKPKDKKSQAILTKGMSCRIENGVLTLGVSNTDGNWTSGMYNYKNASLGRVLDDIERQYDISIVSPAEIKSLNYTGFFESDHLDEALQSVLWPLQLKYEMTGDSEISISKN